VAEQALPFLYGEGANGKSTFLNALHAVMGDYAYTAPDDLLVAKRSRSVADKSAVAGLQGRRFVTTAEVDDGARMAEGLVKQLTGERTLSAKFLYQDHFTFQNVSKVWLVANHKPVVRGTDHAIWRRILLVPFEVTIPPDEQVDDLDETLLEERDGILRWLVDGCLAWQREGLNPPAAVRAATEIYREESNPLHDWYEENVEDDVDESEPFADLWLDYKRYAGARKLASLSKRKLGDYLTARGHESAPGTGGKATRRGLKLRVAI
jgi:putative DNA primase/helicase